MTHEKDFIVLYVHVLDLDRLFPERAGLHG